MSWYPTVNRSASPSSRDGGTLGVPNWAASRRRSSIAGLPGRGLAAVSRGVSPLAPSQTGERRPSVGRLRPRLGDQQRRRPSFVVGVGPTESPGVSPARRAGSPGAIPPTSSPSTAPTDTTVLSELGVKLPPLDESVDSVAAGVGPFTVPVLVLLIAACPFLATTTASFLENVTVEKQTLVVARFAILITLLCCSALGTLLAVRRMRRSLAILQASSASTSLFTVGLGARTFWHASDFDLRFLTAVYWPLMSWLIFAVFVSAAALLTRTEPLRALWRWTRMETASRVRRVIRGALIGAFVMLPIFVVIGVLFADLKEDGLWNLVWLTPVLSILWTTQYTRKPRVSNRALAYAGVMMVFAATLLQKDPTVCVVSALVGDVVFLLSNAAVCVGLHLEPIHAEGEQVLRIGKGKEIEERDRRVAALEKEMVQLKLRREQLRHYSESQVDFTYQYAREVSSAIGTLNSNIDLLQETDLSDAQAEYLRQSQTVAERMLRMASDVRLSTSINSGKTAPVAHAFSPRALAEEAVSALIGSLEVHSATRRQRHADLEMIVDVADRIPTMVVGDEGLIKRAVETLLENAVKFTLSRGEVMLSVQLGRQTDSTVQIAFSVSDTGIGIDDLHAQDIYRPFFKTAVESHGAATGSGSGLGLYLCSRIAKFLGGTLTHTSGRSGSRFTLVVPLHMAAAGTMPELGLNLPVGSLSLRDLEVIRDAHVVVADDNDNARRVVVHILDALHCRVSDAKSMDAALASVREDTRVVIADFELKPPDSGADLIKRVRESYPECQTMLLASLHQRALYDMRSPEWADLILTKPVRLVPLVRGVTSLALVWSRREASEPLLSPRSSEVSTQTRDTLFSVVLVHPDPSVGFEVLPAIEMLGAVCEVVSSVSEALVTLRSRKKPVDLILLGTGMDLPNQPSVWPRSGEEFASWLSRGASALRSLDKEAGWAASHLIAVVKDEGEGDAVARLEAASVVDDVVVRPLTLENLSAAVAAANRPNDTPPIPDTIPHRRGGPLRQRADTLGVDRLRASVGDGQSAPRLRHGETSTNVGSPVAPVITIRPSASIEPLSDSATPSPPLPRRRRSMQGTGRGANDGGQPLVLVVEDNPVSAHIATTVIQNHGYGVAVAEQGKIALDLFVLQNAEIKLVVMDCALPVMDGRTCIAAIRKYEHQHELFPTPIIALNDSANSAAQCLEAGCTTCISKPVDFQRLIEIIGQLVISGRHADQVVPERRDEDESEFEHIRVMPRVRSLEDPIDDDGMPLSSRGPIRQVIRRPMSQRLDGEL